MFVKLTDSIIDTKILKQRYVKIRNWGSKYDQHSILQFLKESEVEVIFVCAFQHILKEKFIKEFDCCINVHPSLLPAYRGPEPIAWGLLDKSDSFGVTLHLVDEGIDTGEIISQFKVNSPFIKNFYFVERQLSIGLDKLIEDALVRLRSNDLYTKKQSKGGFSLPAPTLENRRSRKSREQRQN